MNVIRIDAERLWADVMALAEITEPERPWTGRNVGEPGFGRFLRPAAAPMDYAAVA